MVSEGSVDTTGNRSVQFSIIALREIPDAGRRCQDKLRDSLDEGIDPKAAENEVPDKVSLLLFVFNCGEGGVYALCDFSH